MSKQTTQAGSERVFCEVCLRTVPKAAAAMAETRDYVAYFCGMDCYDKWTGHPPPEAPAEPEIQLGHGRSSSREERMKRALHKNPQRDEPKIDSVEPGEVPPR